MLQMQQVSKEAEAEITLLVETIGEICAMYVASCGNPVLPRAKMVVFNSLLSVFINMTLTLQCKNSAVFALRSAATHLENDSLAELEYSTPTAGESIQ